jgi:hypothetical protein
MRSTASFGVADELDILPSGSRHTRVNEWLAMSRPLLFNQITSTAAPGIAPAIAADGWWCQHSVGKRSQGEQRPLASRISQPTTR